VGFIALALFEQYSDSLSELRHDLKHFNESAGDLVKKDSLRRFRDHIRKWSRDLQDAKEGRILMKKELQVSETARKEMGQQLQMLRERLAGVEGRQAATPIVITAPPSGKNEAH
jgi:chromosome segregation ATPase